MRDKEYVTPARLNKFRAILGEAIKFSHSTFDRAQKSVYATFRNQIARQKSRSKVKEEGKKRDKKNRRLSQNAKERADVIVVVAPPRPVPARCSASCFHCAPLSYLGVMHFSRGELTPGEHVPDQLESARSRGTYVHLERYNAFGTSRSRIRFLSRLLTHIGYTR